MTTLLSDRTRAESEDDPVGLLEDVGALLHGDFTLASGKKSDYYFDSKQLTLDPRGALFVTQCLVSKLDSLGIRYVGGTAYSGIPLASQVALYSEIRDGPPIMAFYHRKEAKGHGTNPVLDGKRPPKGAAVVILEDVVTTGDSLLNAIRLAETDGCQVIHAITLVDRDEGGREAIEAEGYKFWSLFRVELTEGKPRFIFNGG